MTTATKQFAAEGPFDDGRDEAYGAEFQPAIDFFRLDIRRRLPAQTGAASTDQASTNPNEY